MVKGNQLANHEGVEVRPRDWGGVDGLMYQDLHKKIPSYYKQFVETMEKNGWKRGETLFGAPYDWRYAQLRIDDHYDKMQALIEKIYADTGKPVSIYGHSMGEWTTLSPTVAFIVQRLRSISSLDVGWAPFSPSLSLPPSPSLPLPASIVTC